MLSLIVGITALLLLTALPYLIAYWKMLKRTFWCFRSAPAAYNQMPEHLKTFFQPFISELESYGFQVVEFRLFEQTVGDNKQWSVLLQHTSGQIYASCSVSQPFNATMPILLTFLTFLEDGRLMATVNTKFYGIYSRNPQEIVQYFPSVPIVEQWQAHKQKLELLSQTTVFRSLSPGTFVALWKDHSQRSIERLVQTQEVYWAVPGESYRMTWWTTAKALFKVVRARSRERQTSQRQADVASHPISSADSTLALEVEQFYQWQQRQKGDHIDVVFKGVGGHGSSPHLAKDPIIMTAHAITQYQAIVARGIDPKEAAVITVGSVHAGQTANVIPEEALLKINLRWFHPEVRKTLVQGIRSVNESLARAYGMPEDQLPTLTEKSGTTPLVNDAAAIDRLNPQLVNLVSSNKLITDFPGTTGGEDVHLLKGDNKNIQLGFVFIGTAEPALFAKARAEGKIVPFSNHNPDFQVDLNAIPFGTKVASVMSMELLHN